LFCELQRTGDIEGLGYRLQRAQWQIKAFLEVQAADINGHIRVGQTAAGLSQLATTLRLAAGAGQGIGDMQEALLCFFKMQGQRLRLCTKRDECGKGTQCQQRQQPATRGYRHVVSFHSWQARCKDYRAPYRLIQPWSACCWTSAARSLSFR